MIFGVAFYLAERFGKSNNVRKQVTFLLCYLAGMAILAGIGMVMGLSFFAIKLTLYYMPFYYAGYLYGQIDDRLLNTVKGQKTVDCVVALCFVTWLFVILRFALYEMPDSGFAILLRAATSLAGCISICGLLHGIFSYNRGGTLLDWRTLLGSLPPALFVTNSNQNRRQSDVLQPARNGVGSDEFLNDCSACDTNGYGDKPERCVDFCINGKEKRCMLFLWAGRHSLEIYMIHGFFLNIFKSNVPVLFNSIWGYLLTAGNFAVAIGLCVFIIELLNQNKILKKILSIR